MPEGLRAYAAGGVFTADGGSIFFTPDNGAKREVASGFSNISALSVSSDMWRLYVAEKGGNVLYSMAIVANGELKDKMRFAVLYTDTYGRSNGASAMCVDNEDRLYVSTDMGIQVVKSYGIVCAIIDSPVDGRADKIVFGGADMRYLYVEKDGKVARRLWNVAGRPDEKTVTKPVSRDYYA
jgi:sugar lactone lactonase YvrE